LERAPLIDSVLGNLIERIYKALLRLRKGCPLDGTERLREQSMSSKRMTRIVLVILTMAVGHTIAPRLQAATITAISPGRATAINDLGQVVGRTAPSQGVYHGYLWQNGVLTNLGMMPVSGHPTQATAINNNGQVVGYGFAQDGNVHPFVWQNGVITDPGVPPGNVPGSIYGARPTGINDDGMIVGNAFSGLSHAFVSTVGGKASMLPSAIPGSNPASTANGVNELGQIVGSYSRNAAVWENNVLTELGLLPGSDKTMGNAINNNGVIVGNSSYQIVTHTGLSSTIDVPFQAFIWQNGVMSALPLPPVSDSAYANSINDRGDVVGAANGFGNNGSIHAILWKNGAAIDLNAFLPANSGWELLEATGINEAWQIVGYGKYNGVETGFLLEIPEPKSMSLALIGATIVAHLARRRPSARTTSSATSKNLR
jgi:probable HAF family extracellular repeat protein